VPMLVGPVTLVRLAALHGGMQLPEMVERLVPHYDRLLRELQASGASEWLPVVWMCGYCVYLDRRR
jgi:Cobalamin-independent synthase, N-terminal domain